ncbi:hypothetical protein [Dysgonomonas sp. 25]|uniref:hypothetical protein n=1 Tax=Dysgonomonas sp. 25 TaxID=2302933 RepID=UPI0013D36A28|nr:hypothetical protein [Dysgonomonas sp. 25]NDV69256.1 hypothetical protein [Dysgonomonas sp. 25]
MITTIIDIFRRQARQHKAIRAFYYNRSYELGSGREQHPLLWLEDPIYGSNQNHVFSNSVNFAILFLPDEEHSVSELQNLAFSIGLNIIERIKQQEESISIRPDWSYITLCDYYDNNACGCRFSLSFTQVNMQNLCLIDEQFDENGDFEQSSALQGFAVSPASNCEVYSKQFPVFTLKTSK